MSCEPSVRDGLQWGWPSRSWRSHSPVAPPRLTDPAGPSPNPRSGKTNIRVRGGVSWRHPRKLGGRWRGYGQVRSYADSIGTAALMIVRHGVLVTSYGEIGRRYQSHSIRKSLLSALYGL